MSAPLVVVIGLGAAGSAALCQLARRGVAAIGISSSSNSATSADHRTAQRASFG
jgi:tRNA A37 threonylcarbamoyladenosine dehydratase